MDSDLLGGVSFALLFVGLLLWLSRNAKFEHREKEDVARRQEAWAATLKHLSPEDVRWLAKDGAWSARDLLSERDFQSLMRRAGLAVRADDVREDAVPATDKALCPICTRPVRITEKRRRIATHVTGGKRCPGMGMMPAPEPKK